MNKPKVTEISSTLFEVLGHSVKIQTKKSRKLIICNCDNASYFGHNQFCYHKDLVLEHIYTKKIKEKLDKLIEDYESYTNIKGKFDPYVFLNDLKNLRRIL